MPKLHFPLRPGRIRQVAEGGGVSYCPWGDVPFGMTVEHDTEAGLFDMVLHYRGPVREVAVLHDFSLVPATIGVGVISSRLFSVRLYVHREERPTPPVLMTWLGHILATLMDKAPKEGTKMHYQELLRGLELENPNDSPDWLVASLQ